MPSIFCIFIPFFLFPSAKFYFLSNWYATHSHMTAMHFPFCLLVTSVEEELSTAGRAAAGALEILSKLAARFYESCTPNKFNCSLSVKQSVIIQTLFPSTST